MAQQKVPFGEKFAYGFGDLASVLYWATFMSSITYFYTDVFGITAAVLGTMMFVTRIWDGVNDPMMGVIADRTETRWGKFRPFLLWLCVPFALVGVLTFTTPNLSPGGKVAYAYITFTLMMMMYTAINIPYSALLGVISADPVERTSVSSIKFVFAYAAGTIVSATLPVMTKGLGGGNEARGWQQTFVIYGIAAILFFLIAFAFTRERVRPVAKKSNSVGRDLRDLFANTAWVTLLVATILMILFVAGRMTVMWHYFKYYVGTQHVGGQSIDWAVSLGMFGFLGQLAAIPGVLLTPVLARFVGSRNAFLILLAISVLSTALFFFCQPNQIFLMYALNIIGSFTGGPLSPLLWAMYADAADYGEWKTGRRATGLVFSASTMSQKFGWAIGGAGAMWLLDYVGYKANVPPSGTVLTTLRLLMSLIPAALGVLCAVPMLFFKLDTKLMKQIGEELEARRAEASNESSESSEVATEPA